MAFEGALGMILLSFQSLFDIIHWESFGIALIWN